MEKPEHLVDIEGVTGSIPVASTIQFRSFFEWAFRGESLVTGLPRLHPHHPSPEPESVALSRVAGLQVGFWPELAPTIQWLAAGEV